MINIMLDLLLGIITGIIAGLIPGLHINLIKDISQSDIFLISAASAFIVFSILQIFIFYTSITEEIAGLPLIIKIAKKHSLLLIYLYHSLAVFLGMLFALVLYNNGMIKEAYWLIRPFLPYILIIASLILILKSKNRLSFFAFFMLSGLIGYSVFSILQNEPFLPMFSGFFSIPLLLINRSTLNFINNAKEQRINFVEIFLSSLLGSVLGFIAILLPSISSPSVISMLFLPAIEGPVYISLLSSITSSQYVYGMFSFQEIGKPRIGWIQGLKTIDPYYSYTLIFSSIISIIFGFALLKVLTKIKFSFINYLRIFVIIYIIGLTYFISGFTGIFVLCACSLLGILCSNFNVEKTSLLGCLTIPTIILLLF
jgi:putative membrane protein